VRPTAVVSRSSWICRWHNSGRPSPLLSRPRGWWSCLLRIASSWPSRTIWTSPWRAITPLRAQDLTGEKSVFDPSAFLDHPSRQPAPGVCSPDGQHPVGYWDFNAGLRQKLPTGGTYELRFDNEWLNDNSTTTINNTITNAPSGFLSGLGVTLTQPLLRNFGFEANETNIRIASNNQAISQEQLRLRVSDVITQVQTVYVDFAFTIENLEVQRRSLRLAQDLVALNKARVRAGVAAPVEVTQAEALEAARVQDVILAEKAVRDAEDTLKVLMNLPATGGWGQELRPSYTMTFEPRTPNLDESIQKALDNRYEYKSAKLDIDNRDLSVRLTRNQLLPDLSLAGGVSTNGFGTSYGNNMSNLGSGDFISYSVG
jgi:outer membrane protein TolC